MNSLPTIFVASHSGANCGMFAKIYWADAKSINVWWICMISIGTNKYIYLLAQTKSTKQTATCILYVLCNKTSRGCYIIYSVVTRRSATLLRTCAFIQLTNAFIGLSLKSLLRINWIINASITLVQYLETANKKYKTHTTWEQHDTEDFCICLFPERIYTIFGHSREHVCILYRHVMCS